MMKLLLALTFGLLTVSSFGQYRDNYGFPLFEEVLSYLDKNIDRPCSNCYFGIAKKIDGYYLVLKEIDQGDISNRNFVKVWDQKQNKFIKPQIAKYLVEENDGGGSRTFRSFQDLRLPGMDRRPHRIVGRSKEFILKRTGTIANLKWTTLRLEAMKRDLVSLKL